MARLTTIRLYGVLGARFGRVHRLAVQTSAEAVKALCINLDGLESYLLNAKKNGMTFVSAGVIGAGMVSAGIGMMAGGIYQMLSPQPKGLQGRDDPDNKPSYAFGGSVNTLAMGNPVALLYGEREIGGAIISAGIVAEDI